MSHLIVTCSSFLLGTIIVVQAFVNINLAEALGHPLRAACISFCVGACSLLILLTLQSMKESTKLVPPVSPEIEAELAHKPIIRHVREISVSSSLVDETAGAGAFVVGNDDPPVNPSAKYESNVEEKDEEVKLNNTNHCTRIWRIIDIPYYYYGGGLLGAFYVSNAAISVPHIGYSVFYVCFVSGQLLCALAFDRFGLLESPVMDIHPGRYVGCLCSATGSVMLLLVGGTSKTSPALMSLMVLGSFLSGVFLVTQSAVNTILRKRAGYSIIGTALTSFSVGAGSLFIISAITFISPGVFSAIPPNFPTLRWWHFFGGIIGIVYVKSAVVFPHIIGYAAFVVALIAGQLVTSLLSDRFGLFGPKKPTAYDPLGILGVCLGILGAALVSIFKHKVQRV